MALEIVFFERLLIWLSGNGNINEEVLPQQGE